MLIKNKSISNLIRFTNHYFGWRNWAVLAYNSIMENMFVIFYILLRQEAYSSKYVFYFFIFLFFSSFCTTYGYLVNDLGDKNLDELHGKSNTFRDDSYPKAYLIVLFFLLLAILFSLPFIKNSLFLTTFIIWLSIATAYSLKPFRLKEKGKTGLIFVVIAQRFLPALLIFIAFGYYEWVDLIIFSSYIFFRGLSSDLNHQLEDFEKDYETGTETYAVKSGSEKTTKLFWFSLDAERILLILCLLLMLLKLTHINFYSIPIILPIFILHIFLCCFFWIKIVLIDKKTAANPFDPGRKDVLQFIHHAFPSVVLPLYLLMILVFKQIEFLSILISFILVRRLFSFKLILNSYPARFMISLIQK